MTITLSFINHSAKYTMVYQIDSLKGFLTLRSLSQGDLKIVDLSEMALLVPAWAFLCGLREPWTS